MCRKQFIRVVAFFLVVCPALHAGADTLPQTVRFNRDIRPILSDNCFNCHGPDRNTRKAGLRLDTPEGARADLGGYFAVVPGKPADSEVFRRISTTDKDDLMPPPKSGKQLTPHQIALVERWIEQGADWEGHWAYLPPTRPPVPTVKNKKWPENPIDHFILARLEAQKLRPSPEADKRTLLRRVGFDVIGLPPAPEEADAFLADRSRSAYGKVVDRLLASPHFGERMAMHWLDLVRYADTVGFHGDQPVNVWPYRDYVIKAFNENKPFDQFTREQLAGDLLPEATREQKVASGYNRLHKMTGEGGAQDKEYLAIYSADRVRTTASVWLGATMGCAECHDHKFDPITAKDFYSFASFFGDLKEKGFYPGGQWEPYMPLPNADQEAQLKQFAAEIAALQNALDTPTDALGDAELKWEEKTVAEIEGGHHAWKPQKPSKFVSSGGSTLKLQKDLSLLSTGGNPGKDSYTVTLEPDLERITAIRLDALTHRTFANSSLSRGNGNFVLTGFDVEVAGADGTSTPVKIAKAVADHEQAGFPITAALDGRSDTGWAVDDHAKASHRKAAFTFAEPLVPGPDTTLRVHLKHESAHDQHNIGRFRLSLSSSDDPALPGLELPDPIVETLQVARDQRNAKQTEAVARYYRSIAPELAGTREQLAAVTQQKTDLEAQIPATLVSVSVEPRPIRVLPRGNWMDDSGEVVAPAVPHFLPQPAGADRRLTRLDLADWMTSRDNPLTARVFVNRLWNMYFGTGISKVLDDLGSQGEWPVHPELLDWLSVEFIESGWDVKHIVRLMITSAAYRQSSMPTEKLRELDPFNRLHARQSRFRLDAEFVRDNALAVSGLLVSSLGGPSARPYQPPGYYAQLNFPKREYEADKGGNQYRRGLYTHWQRTFLHPSLMAFDAPSREECTAERPRSNTPLQALVLLNDPSYVEAARVFAGRIVQDGGASPSDRLKWAYRRALSREPNRQEQRALTELYRAHRELYAANEAAAREVLNVGDKPAADVNPVELAAWTSVSRVILNLHEMITRY